MELCFATHNQNKVREIRSLLKDGFSVRTLSDLGIDEDIEETGTTLEENSMLKARFLYDKLGIPVIADDSGLEVSFLKGAPGVYSARYAGLPKNDDANIDLLLRELGDTNERSARFRTVITLIKGGGHQQFEGVVDGEIIFERRGSGGFGYDPVFIPGGEQRTFAEMSLAEKNEMSHRARAFRKLADHLNGSE